MRNVYIGCIAIMILVSTACSNRNDVTNDPKALSAAEVPIVIHQEGNYISLNKLIDLLGFQMKWDPSSQTARIGDHDVIYEIKANSKNAVKHEESIQLSSVPIVIGDSLYIPIAAIPALFEDTMSYEIMANRLIVYRPDIVENKRETEPNLGFENSLSMTALRQIDETRLINKAKRYRGVKYEFGASPYEQSKRFDCSSFTQHVFADQGVTLPRTAHDQSKQGYSVSRSSLEKGDLLFFTVPGRFKSSGIVGHVGIYMGNNVMIHSSPEPENAVQITNINKAYWKETFMKAKRIAS